MSFRNLFPAVLLFICACSGEKTAANTSDSFEDVMLRFMTTRYATNFYVPDYSGLETEARRLKFYIEERCPAKCSLGVFTQEDQYTLDLVAAYCADKSKSKEATIEVLVRNPTNFTPAGCSNVQILGLSQLFEN